MSARLSEDQLKQTFRPFIGHLEINTNDTGKEKDDDRAHQAHLDAPSESDRTRDVEHALRASNRTSRQCARGR